MNNVIKCPHCNKIFFDIQNNNCPFCGKYTNVLPDTFKNMFGKDNPFNEIFGGKI